MNQTEAEKQISTYNEGLFQIQRLHELKLKANQAAMRGNYSTWRWTLDTIWRELSTDATKEDREQRKQLDQAITRAILLAPVQGKRNLYTALGDYDEFLRSLQDQSGKGAKYKDEDDGLDI